jgi:hypothetical protein
MPQNWQSIPIFTMLRTFTSPRGKNQPLNDVQKDQLALQAQGPRSDETPATFPIPPHSLTAE